MLLADLASTSRKLAETGSRLDKVSMLSEVLRRTEPGETEIAVDYLSGRLRQGRIGLGGSAIGAAIAVSPAARSSVTLRETDQAFAELAAIAGSGSAAARKQRLAALFSRATGDEQIFLARLLAGELRQGAQEGVMIEAIARAAQVPAADVRRAVMVAGDAAIVARAVLTEGAAGLRRFALSLFTPVRPMLAQPANDIEEALEALGTAALEYKVDGARVQAHKLNDDVRIFTRSLNEVTESVPELVAAVRALPARSLILDGEAIALRADGKPQPFQITMRRFGRKLDVDAMRTALPLSVFFFDVLHLDGQDLIALPGEARFEALRKNAPHLAIPHVVSRDISSAQAFLDEALSAGHEGVMAKALDAPYEAGNRGASWLKIKRTHTLDLVVLAAEWGHGRRSQWLSNLHLGARDPDSGSFVMLGKTFKGMTDAMLAWQTMRLQELAIGQEGIVVHVRPELVVEIAFNDIQESPQYPGGLALRFARVKRYRTDKRPNEADTIDTVRALYAGQPPGGASVPGL